MEKEKYCLCVRKYYKIINYVNLFDTYFEYKYRIKNNTYFVYLKGMSFTFKEKEFNKHFFILD